MVPGPHARSRGPVRILGRSGAGEHCHGDVSQMARVVQTQPLTMGWCLDCHRAAQEPSFPHSAPGSVPANAWEAALDMFLDTPSEHRAITALTTCSACHR